MPDLAFELQTHGTPETVRAILADLRNRLNEIGVTEDCCGTIEIALAEALNNIVEHAYAPDCEGPIWLSAARDEGVLAIELRDTGRPLPGLTLPQAQLPDATGPLLDLPEGGFGWYLIHDLTETLSYARLGQENRLSLGFGINA